VPRGVNDEKVYKVRRRRRTWSTTYGFATGSSELAGIVRKRENERAMVADGDGEELFQVKVQQGHVP